MKKIFSLFVLSSALSFNIAHAQLPEGPGTPLGSVLMSSDSGSAISEDIGNSAVLGGFITAGVLVVGVGSIVTSATDGHQRKYSAKRIKRQLSSDCAAVAQSPSLLSTTVLPGITSNLDFTSPKTSSGTEAAAKVCAVIARVQQDAPHYSKDQNLSDYAAEILKTSKPSPKDVNFIHNLLAINGISA